MRIVEINSMNFGSTGKIMIGIANAAQERGHDIWTFNPAGRTQKKGLPGNYTIGNRYERFVSEKINYFFGKQSALNLLGTYKFLLNLEKIKPDIIHLHNLHSNFINWEMLFRYICKKKIKIVWTLHDCLAFTGHCSHFDIVGCGKWKSGCYSCPIIHEYPAIKWDFSKREYRRKRKLFTSVDVMVAVTPSQWLKRMTEESYLKKYPIIVIPNGIDLNIFKPRISDIRKRYKLENKFIVLGMAYSWGRRKGLDVFKWLAERLSDEYQIVLVGVNERIDKELPSNIISIQRTDNPLKLAEMYSVADLFVNPTREEVMGLVNVEALACGTPVITFDSGGSAECIDKTCGIVVKRDDNDMLIEKIREVKELKPFEMEKCVTRARDFDKEIHFKKYIDLYERMMNNENKEIAYDNYSDL